MTDHWDIAAFEAAVAAGRFDGPVELWDGKVWPLGTSPEPDAATENLREELEDRLRSQQLAASWRVISQSAIDLRGTDRRPEPDLMIVRRARPYRRPTPADTLAVIEVARTSRRRNEGAKARLYRAGSISHYWVLECDVLDTPRLWHWGQLAMTLHLPELDLSLTLTELADVLTR